ncbi:pseudouridine synthase [uncultured Methylophaga sp.]|uniref:pseudouridine synthase n=1 Tax=uncultured Methylophaga sp. TaxID=285271 RepID=UPI00262A2634|nr:pseudouridine synthase [uncultured Methylophaga sp.]
MSQLILFNKPFNVLTQFTDGADRQTLKDFIDIRDVYPGGRLDRDSEGLVLLTDDGQLQQLIANPRFKLQKTYWVQVEHKPDERALQQLREGLELKDGPTLPAQAEIIAPPAIWDRHPPIRERKAIPTQWLELSISEGRNRQVRRMTAAVGHPTLRLIRVAIGPWQIDNLQPGQWQAIAEEDVIKWRNDLETQNNRRRRGRAGQSLPAGRRRNQRRNDVKPTRRPSRTRRKPDRRGHS